MTTCSCAGSAYGSDPRGMPVEARCHVPLSAIDEIRSWLAAKSRATGNAIAGELSNLLVGGLRYKKVMCDARDAEWEMTAFQDEQLVNYLNSLQTSPGKSLYEFVEYDSEVERAFARKLDSREDIQLFVKLPRWFVVDTPVGDHPDWAIVKRGSTTVYMVRETKGTRDYRKLRGVENDNVRCGEKHFDTIGVSFDVVVTAESI